MVGSVTLYIDPHWLTPASEGPLGHEFGRNCPSQPVKIDKLYFRNVILDLVDMPAGLWQAIPFSGDPG
jgi:hypothetical protein